MRIPTEFLSPGDFEKFANKVVGTLFNKTIISFGEGRDGGIDGLDDSVKPSIIVQSKRYQPTTQPSTLLRTIKSEISKLVETSKKNNFNDDFDYIIVTSARLNPKTRKEIRDLKEEWIKTDKHIIDANTLESLSTDPSYTKIFREYNLINGKLIDEIGEINLELIKSEDFDMFFNFDSNYIVITTAIKKAYECMRENKLVFLVGHPGVGKSVSSQYLGLLASKWKDKPVSVICRSVEDTDNILEMFQTAFKDKERSLVVIFDDFLGRNTFDAREKDLKYIKRLAGVVSNSDNFFIIFNSRIEILEQGSNDHIEFGKFIEKLNDKKVTINLTELSVIDKSKILRKNFEKEYHKAEGIEKTNLYKNYNEIRKDKFYCQIVKHKNYNPRIIEFIVREARNLENNFINKINKMLENPKKLYDEIYRKLGENEKLFLYVFSSFGRYPINCSKVEILFNKVRTNPGTIDDVYAMLDGAWIRRAYSENEQIIDFLNPSLYDYLILRLKEDKYYIEKIIENTPYLENIQNLCFEKFEEEISNNFKNYEDYNYFIGNKILNIVHLDEPEEDFKSWIYCFQGAFLVNGIERNWNDVLEDLILYNGKLKHFFVHELIFSRKNKELLDLILKDTNVKDIINNINNLLLDECPHDENLNELIDLGEERTGCNLFSELCSALENQISYELNDEFNAYYLIEEYYEKTENDIFDFFIDNDLGYGLDYSNIVYYIVEEYLASLKDEINEELFDRIDIDMIVERVEDTIITVLGEYVEEHSPRKFEEKYYIKSDKVQSIDMDSILDKELTDLVENSI